MELPHNDQTLCGGEIGVSFVRNGCSVIENRTESISPLMRAIFIALIEGDPPITDAEQMASVVAKRATLFGPDTNSPGSLQTEKSVRTIIG